MSRVKNTSEPGIELFLSASYPLFIVFFVNIISTEAENGDGMATLRSLIKEARVLENC